MDLLQSLSGSCGVLPASYTLEGEAHVSDELVWAVRGFGEVWRGTLGSGEMVAIKAIKIGIAPSLKKLKKVGVGT